ncbi:GDNF family receptor alpha-2-like [Salvelinus alpinus]|uniref:GDNF family receptor alpha n=1 Tax=Salvelinus namaycush TaxID=8040 RepID=A0A8U1BHS5_SALNM|nr:GDNF family receptor alpha-2 [Salvelinus alpinus]XP_038856540.1 GDNF family receptor alpha-2-like [Salvelinus namaycush]
MMWIYFYFVLFLLDGVAYSSGGSYSALAGTGAHGWVDCVRASDMCNQNPQCSSRYRVMRQCLVGRERDTMLANRECQAALEVLLVSPLYDCRCKRGMKKELQCLQSYWSIHMGLTEGREFYETSPYEPVMPVRHPDAFRLASIISGMHTVTPKANTCSDPSKTCNPCLDAAKACNLNNTCKKQRSTYIATCSKGEPCNRKRCHKALRQFLDRVPTDYSHQLLFCPCQDLGCAERRRQTIVPFCSFEDKVKPYCLELRKNCRQDPLCRSRLADFHMNCMVSQHTVSSCPNEDNYQACLASYAGLIGTDMTPNYVDGSFTNWTVSPWCTCKGSGNQEEECQSFLKDFTENMCLRNAIQAFGYGTDSLSHKAESVPLTPSMKPGLETSISTSEPLDNPNDVQPEDEANGKGNVPKWNLSKGYIGGDGPLLEPSSGYDGLTRPKGPPEDGSPCVCASVWALLLSLTSAVANYAL